MSYKAHKAFMEGSGGHVFHKHIENPVLTVHADNLCSEDYKRIIDCVIKALGNEFEPEEQV